MLFNPLFTAVIVVLYGSFVNLLPYKALYRHKLYTPINLIFLIILLTLNRDLEFSTLGISPSNLLSSSFLGFVIGSITVLISTLFILKLERKIKLKDPRFFFLKSPQTLMFGVFVHILIGTVIFEEIIHRGIVLARFQEIMDPISAIFASSLIFAFWHIVSVVRLIWPSIKATIRLLPFQYVSLLGTFLLMFIGGLIFSSLRVYSGNIIGSMIAHGMINSGTLVAFYILRNKDEKD